MFWFLRSNRSECARRAHSAGSVSRARLSLFALDDRIVPTTNLILDFDGGTLQTGSGYIFPSGFGTGVGGNTYSA